MEPRIISRKLRLASSSEPIATWRGDSPARISFVFFLFVFHNCFNVLLIYGSSGSQWISKCSVKLKYSAVRLLSDVRFHGFHNTGQEKHVCVTSTVSGASAYCLGCWANDGIGFARLKFEAHIVPRPGSLRPGLHTDANTNTAYFPMVSVSMQFCPTELHYNISTAGSSHPKIFY